MEMARALGVEPAWAAEMLPEIEVVMVRATNERLAESREQGGRGRLLGDGG